MLTLMVNDVLTFLAGVGESWGWVVALLWVCVYLPVVGVQDLIQRRRVQRAEDANLEKLLRDRQA